LRGEFIRGWDDGRSVDSGRAFGSAQLDQMQKLTGGFMTAYRAGWNAATGAFTEAFSPIANLGFNGAANATNKTVSMDSANSPNARVSSTTSGETRARNVALLACIKF
jgi:phage-related tail fiber protein